MAIKSILLAYSGDAASSGALRLAVLITRKYQAHLTGVVSHGSTLSEAKYADYMGKRLLDLLHSRDEEAVKALEIEFLGAVKEQLGSQDAEFLDLHAEQDFTLIEAARAYDIVVMGRRAFEPGHEHFGISPSQMALESGRPVLLVPHTYAETEINEHAVVAWDGKRASARAVLDAMHILETKKMVTVLTIGDATSDDHPGDDIKQLLERHGLEVNRVHEQSAQASVASQILDVCQKVDAGLLVMGAYETSATRETLFGGTTVDILKDAHLPVFMSH